MDTCVGQDQRLQLRDYDVRSGSCGSNWSKDRQRSNWAGSGSDFWGDLKGSQGERGQFHSNSDPGMTTKHLEKNKSPKLTLASSF